jgi:putative transposase
LHIQNMIKNGRVGRHVGRASWDYFFECLNYKTDWYGGYLLRVDPRHTSQTCNHCGAVDRKSRISQSKFVCVECGAESNADTNAAKNILGRAMSSVR